jgi:hypothetical protein
MGANGFVGRRVSRPIILGLSILIAVPLLGGAFGARPADASEGGAGDRPSRPSPPDCRPPLQAGDEACQLIAKTHRVLGRMSSSAVDYVQTVASEFNLEGNLRLQESLLREDLIWQQRGLSPEQLNVMVFVAVGLSLQDAEGLVDELRRSLGGRADADAARRLQRVQLYREQAITFLKELAPQVDKVREAELRFGFY